MPIRRLRDQILTSDRVDKLDAPQEVFYRRLMSVVDDFGRFDARPSILRPVCFPLRVDKVREADILRWLAACQTAELIVLYEVGDKPYLVLLNVEKPRAEHSKFPDPPNHPALTCARMRADGPYSYSTSITNSYPRTTAHSGGETGKDKDEAFKTRIAARKAKNGQPASH